MDYKKSRTLLALIGYSSGDYSPLRWHSFATSCSSSSFSCPFATSKSRSFHVIHSNSSTCSPRHRFKDYSQGSRRFIPLADANTVFARAGQPLPRAFPALHVDRAQPVFLISSFVLLISNLILIKYTIMIIFFIIFFNSFINQSIFHIPMNEDLSFIGFQNCNCYFKKFKTLR